MMYRLFRLSRIYKVQGRVEKRKVGWMLAVDTGREV